MPCDTPGHCTRAITSVRPVCRHPCRTAVRNLERAAVSRSVAMKMTGHKTEAAYRRYTIVSESDLHEAALTLAAVELGKVQGKVVAVSG